MTFVNLAGYEPPPPEPEAIPLPPCAGCGHDDPDGCYHHGVCDQRVAETARRCRPDAAFRESVKVAEAWSDPWRPEARFWRDVTDEIDYQRSAS